MFLKTLLFLCLFVLFCAATNTKAPTTCRGAVTISTGNVCRLFLDVCWLWSRAQFPDSCAHLLASLLFGFCFISNMAVSKRWRAFDRCDKHSNKDAPKGSAFPCFMRWKIKSFSRSVCFCPRTLQFLLWWWWWWWANGLYLFRVLNRSNDVIGQQIFVLIH